MRHTLSILLALAGSLAAGTSAGAAAPPTGDRHVTSTIAPGIDSAYRLFVPEDWKPGDRWPLVTILHGGGSTEDSPFDRTPGFKDALEAAARRYHLILVSPRGHKGWWGARMLTEKDPAPIVSGTYRWPPAGALTGPPPALPPLSDSDLALSARDVLATEDAVRAAYNTDPGRSYLIGNSMGSIGALHLVQANPGRWCAIAPSDGPVDPVTYPYERARGAVSAAFFVHGDDDRTAPIESMRAIADGFVRAGVPTRFLTVPGGTHGNSWQRALPEILSFLLKHDCGAGAPAHH